MSSKKTLLKIASENPDLMEVIEPMLKEGADRTLIHLMGDLESRLDLVNTHLGRLQLAVDQVDEYDTDEDIIEGISSAIEMATQIHTRLEATTKTLRKKPQAFYQQ